MEIFGIGTDIIEIDRFQKKGEPPSERFMARCYTEREIMYLKGKRLESIAGYFAAKEAVAKALGTGFSGFMPNAIEIIRNKAGKPEVVLHDGAARIAKEAKITHIDVSISHCETYATGMAIAQRGPRCIDCEYASNNSKI